MVREVELLEVRAVFEAFEALDVVLIEVELRKPAEGDAGLGLGLSKLWIG